MQEQARAFVLSLQHIQDAIVAARERGETTCTDRFLKEAFTSLNNLESP